MKTGHKLGRGGSASADPVRIAQLLVQMPSVNPVLENGGAGEGAIARLTGGWLAEWGYETGVTQVSPGRYNVVARKGKRRGPSLILNGHLDTVGVAGMSDPFSGRVDGGRLYGRGAADMKSGVASILSVAAQLAREEIKGELIVALTADEEHASLGMEAFVESGCARGRCGGLRANGVGGNARAQGVSLDRGEVRGPSRSRLPARAGRRRNCPRRPLLGRP